MYEKVPSYSSVGDAVLVPGARLVARKHISRSELY
jgi:hypothetical protein